MSCVSDYAAGVARLAAALPETSVNLLVDWLEEAWRDGRHVILMGNGGSASTASHIVNDLQKCIQLDTGRALKALCLCDSTPLVMAWANDTEYANVFAPQVECWAGEGDLVIGISGSGNSPNVINGIIAARSVGARTFGLAGFAGGRLAREAEATIVIPSDSMQQIEDLHMVVLHAAFVALRTRLGGASGC